MKSSGHVLQQGARIHLGSCMAVTGLGLDVPGTVRVLEADTGPAACLGGAPLQGQGLDFVVTERHQLATLARIPADHEEVLDGDMDGEHLDLLDDAGAGNAGVIRIGGHLDHATSCCPDEQNINRMATEVRHGHAGIHGHGGQSLLRTGLDEVGSVDGGGHSTVHQSVFFDEVEIFVIQ